MFDVVMHSVMYIECRNAGQDRLIHAAGQISHTLLQLPGQISPTVPVAAAQSEEYVAATGTDFTDCPGSCNKLS